MKFQPGLKNFLRGGSILTLTCRWWNPGGILSWTPKIQSGYQETVQAGDIPGLRFKTDHLDQIPPP